MLSALPNENSRLSFQWTTLCEIVTNLLWFCEEVVERICLKTQNIWISTVTPVVKILVTRQLTLNLMWHREYGRTTYPSHQQNWIDSFLSWRRRVFKAAFFRVLHNCKGNIQHSFYLVTEFALTFKLSKSQI